MRIQSREGDFPLAKLTKTTLYKEHFTRPETPMEKTTRIVREIADEEAEQRQVKNARLRTARLEREENTPAEAVGVARKSRPSIAATKR